MTHVHLALIAAAVILEMWLLAMVVSAIKRKRREREALPSVSTEVRQSSHRVKNDVSAIRSALRLLPDPFQSLVDMSRDIRKRGRPRC